MEEGKRERRGMEGFQRDMQHRAGILADRIQHYWIAEFGNNLSHYVNCFGFEALEVKRQTRGHGKIALAMNKGPAHIIDIIAMQYA